MSNEVNLDKLKARAADIRSAVQKIQMYTGLSDDELRKSEGLCTFMA